MIYVHLCCRPACLVPTEINKRCNSAPCSLRATRLMAHQRVVFIDAVLMVDPGQQCPQLLRGAVQHAERAQHLRRRHARRHQVPGVAAEAQLLHRVQERRRPAPMCLRTKMAVSDGHPPCRMRRWYPVCGIVAGNSTCQKPGPNNASKLPKGLRMAINCLCKPRSRKEAMAHVSFSVPTCPVVLGLAPRVRGAVLRDTGLCAHAAQRSAAADNNAAWGHRRSLCGR